MNALCLDSLLDISGAALWLGKSERWLADDAAKDKPTIPVFKVGSSKRWHPRTIIAVLARRAGIPGDVMAASFGLQEKETYYPHRKE